VNEEANKEKVTDIIVRRKNIFEETDKRNTTSQLTFHFCCLLTNKNIAFPSFFHGSNPII